MQGKLVQGHLAEKCTSCCRSWPWVRLQSGKQIWGLLAEWLSAVGGYWCWFPGTLQEETGPAGVSSGEQNFHTAQGWARKGNSRACFCQLLCHPFASLNYLTLNLREGWSQLTNKRLHTLLQDSLCVTKAFLLSSVGLAVFLARKITTIWDFGFCLTLCFQMTQGPEITWSLKAISSV